MQVDRDVTTEAAAWVRQQMFDRHEARRKARRSLPGLIVGRLRRLFGGGS
jgi:hypothetical protein